MHTHLLHTQDQDTAHLQTRERKSAFHTHIHTACSLWEGEKKGGEKRRKKHKTAQANISMQHPHARGSKKASIESTVPSIPLPHMNEEYKSENQSNKTQISRSINAGYKDMLATNGYSTGRKERENMFACMHIWNTQIHTFVFGEPHPSPVGSNWISTHHLSHIDPMVRSLVWIKDVSLFLAHKPPSFIRKWGLLVRSSKNIKQHSASNHEVWCMLCERTLHESIVWKTQSRSWHSRMYHKCPWGSYKEAAPFFLVWFNGRHTPWEVSTFMNAAIRKTFCASNQSLNIAIVGHCV